MNELGYAVRVQGVDHIILDNLQFMLQQQYSVDGESGGGGGGGESNYNKFDLQDKALTLFRRFATEEDVHLTLVIHPKKEIEGQLLGMHSVFGGAKATQEADNVRLFYPFLIYFYGV